jgi:hypothetical protein
VLYARWEIQAFRDVERFPDYRKLKDRLRRTLDKDATLRRKPHWRSLLSDKALTVIIAIGTVVLVLVGVASLVLALR